MALKPPFVVKVEGLGTWTFRHRNLRDEISIQAKFDALVEGIAAPSNYLDVLATALSTYQVLAVTWPEGWSPQEVAEMDAVMDDRIADLRRVHGAFCLREDEFRPDGKRRYAPKGPGDMQEPGGVVSPEIQPPAD